MNGNRGYTYDLKDCDPSVTDRAALEAFRAKRATWVEWIEDDEHHAIWTVLHDMIWSDVVFKSFSRLAAFDDNNPLNNHLLGEALIRGTLANQVLAIRRLLDKGKGRISIRRLLADIRSDIRLFTRENYVCFDGLTYDYEAVKADEIPKLVNRGGVWVDTTGPRGWGTSERAHRQFDRLMGLTEKSKRQRKDPVPLSLLDKLERWIADSPADEIAEWSHAYLAHAGSPAERGKIAALSVSGNKITEAIRALARVTEGISAYLLFAAGRSSSLTPVAQFDKFEKLDGVVMPSLARPDIEALWKTAAQEKDGWLDDVGLELVPPKVVG